MVALMMQFVQPRAILTMGGSKVMVVRLGIVAQLQAPLVLATTMKRLSLPRCPYLKIDVIFL